jgi:hypothetical protein
MAFVIIILLVCGAIFGMGYRWGWNKACALYRDRTVEGAEKRYQDDIK